MVVPHDRDVAARADRIVEMLDGRPTFLGRVQARFQTPDAAIALSLAIGAGIALLGDIGLVAQSANFAIFLGFVAVNLSLIALRFTQPEVKRPFRLAPSVGKVPLIPVLALGSIAFMTTNLEIEAIAIGFVIVAVGAVATTVGMATSTGRPNGPPR